MENIQPVKGLKNEFFYQEARERDLKEIEGQCDLLNAFIRQAEKEIQGKKRYFLFSRSCYTNRLIKGFSVLFVVSLGVIGTCSAFIQSTFNRIQWLKEEMSTLPQKTGWDPQAGSPSCQSFCDDDSKHDSISDAIHEACLPLCKELSLQEGAAAGEVIGIMLACCVIIYAVCKLCAPCGKAMVRNQEDHFVVPYRDISQFSSNLQGQYRKIVEICAPWRTGDTDLDSALKFARSSLGEREQQKALALQRLHNDAAITFPTEPYSVRLSPRW